MDNVSALNDLLKDPFSTLSDLLKDHFSTLHNLFSRIPSPLSIGVLRGRHWASVRPGKKLFRKGHGSMSSIKHLSSLSALSTYTRKTLPEYSIVSVNLGVTFISLIPVLQSLFNLDSCFTFCLTSYRILNPLNIREKVKICQEYVDKSAKSFQLCLYRNLLAYLQEHFGNLVYIQVFF